MAAQGLNWNGNGVSLDGLGILISGPPGYGKSELSLELIDRGGTLIGDDMVRLERATDSLVAFPPGHHRGQMEIRNLGIIDLGAAVSAPVALIIELDPDAPRFIETPDMCQLLGKDIPLVRLQPKTPALAIRTEWALRKFVKNPRKRHFGDS